MLGVAVSTVQKWVELGQMASWKTPGGHRRIPLQEVRKLLATATVTPSGPAPAGMAADAGPNDGARPLNGAVQEEPARMLAMHASGLLDTAAHASYDRIVRLASQIADVPIALITLLDEHRQWFKARIGMSKTQTPRAWAFCDHAIRSDAMLVVEDALEDPRFAENPLVTGAEGVRFYAGVPVLDASGFRLGTLCVLDRRPRKLTHDHAWALTELAALVSEEIGRSGK